MYDTNGKYVTYDSLNSMPSIEIGRQPTDKKSDNTVE